MTKKSKLRPAQELVDEWASGDEPEGLIADLITLVRVARVELLEELIDFAKEQTSAGGYPWVGLSLLEKFLAEARTK